MNAAFFSLLSLLFGLPLTTGNLARHDVGGSSCSQRLTSSTTQPSTASEDAATRPVISHISRERVRSTVIASIGYSRRRHILEIEFVSGAIYRYLEVAPSAYRDLMIADSKARYYDAYVRRKYISVRVRPRAGALKH